MLLTETNFNTKKTEEDGKLYLSGIFVQAECVNKNKRMYPKQIMESAVQKYKTDFIDRNMGVAELEHPQTLSINPERIAAKIVELKESEPNNYYGKALVVDTPCGNIVKGLISGGISVGMSSRAEGSVKMTESGVAVVQNDLRLVAIDVVMSPSAPDAYVQGIMESASPFWNSIEEYADANLIESFKREMQGMTTKQINEQKYAMFQKFVEAIKVKN